MRSSAFHVRFSSALARSAVARRALLSWLLVWLFTPRLRPLVGTWIPMPALW